MPHLVWMDEYKVRVVRWTEDSTKTSSSLASPDWKDSNLVICLQPDFPIQAWRLDSFEWRKFEFSFRMQRNRGFHRTTHDRIWVHFVCFFYVVFILSSSFVSNSWNSLKPNQHCVVLCSLCLSFHQVCICPSTTFFQIFQIHHWLAFLPSL